MIIHFNNAGVKLVDPKLDVLLINPKFMFDSKKYYTL